jgi:hypothetical protein
MNVRLCFYKEKEYAMAYGDGNEKIRRRAWEQVIEPQIRSGSRHVSVAIKPLMKEMEAEGFTPNRPRQFCTALQKKDFLREKNLVLERVEGPPSGTSTTVVLHYSYGGARLRSAMAASGETPAEKADRLIGQMRGLMKKTIDSHGGAEAFIRWVRSDSDEDAA